MAKIKVGDKVKVISLEETEYSLGLDCEMCGVGGIFEVRRVWFNRLECLKGFKYLLEDVELVEDEKIEVNHIITDNSITLSYDATLVTIQNDDRRFEAIIEACARIPRKGEPGTWLLPEMKEAYVKLHELGLAHSFEVYENEVLVGGLYGVSIGRLFFGESMFHSRSDASKFALSGLCEFCKNNGIELIDVQMETDHLTSLGGEFMEMDDYMTILKSSRDEGSIIGKWKL